MGFAANKARVRSNIAKGGYQAPDNTLAEGIMTASNIIAKGILDRGEERRAEEKRKAAAAAKLAKEQKEKERKAKERERKAKALAVELGADPSNSEAVSYFTEQLFFFDDNAGAVYSKAEADLKKGKIDFVPKETGPMQGPLLQPMTPTEIDSAEQSTANAVANATSNERKQEIIDTANNGFEPARNLSQQMQSILDQTGALSDEQIASQTYEGLQIDPTAKEKTKIDWTTINSEADIVALESAMNVGQIDASDADKKELARRKQSIADQKAIIPWKDITKDNYEQFARKFTDMGLAGKAETIRGFGIAANKKKLTTADIYALDVSVLEAMVAADEVDEKQVDTFAKAIEDKYKDIGRELSSKSVEELVATANNPMERDDIREVAKTMALSLDGSDFDIKGYDDVKIPTLVVARDAAPEGSKKRAQLTSLINLKKQAELSEIPELNLDGGFFITRYLDEEGNEIVANTAPSSGGLYDIERNQVIPDDRIVDNKSVKALDTLADTFTQANSKVFLPITEKRGYMTKLVRSAERLESFVNPELGGRPEILTTVGGDITRVVKRLENEYAALNSMFLSGRSEQEIFAYIDSQASTMGELAGLSTQFQAELLKHAYLFAATTLEQTGQGLSNTDFKQALAVVKAGSTYETFSNNLRSQTLQGMESFNDLVSDLDQNGMVMILDQLDTTGNLTAGYKKTAQDYLTERNLGGMIEWANSKAKPVQPNAGDTEKGPDTKTIGTKVSGWRNGNTFTGDYKQFANMPENLRDAWAKVVANTNGIPKQAVLDAFAAQAKASEEGQ